VNIKPLDPIPCPGCGFSSSGVDLDCIECARRHPDLFVRAAADMGAELDELRRILIAAENWFLSIDATRTPQEADLALALRARNPRLGVNRGIRIEAQS
jgi:hypothetical protein